MKIKRLIDFNNYAKLLEDCLDENGVISEDTARYLFYANVIKEHNLANKTLAKIHLEVPYSDARLKIKNNALILKGNSELDSYYEFGNEKYAIEFKFHREISNRFNKKIIPHTKYAGEIFDDINRLSIIDKSINRYFIYLMDKGMINYKKSDINRSVFQRVVSLKENKKTIVKQDELKKNQSKTFINEAFSSFKKGTKLLNVKVRMEKSIFFEVNKNRYHLIVLEII